MQLSSQVMAADEEVTRMHEAFIVEGVRSPVGRYGGALATVRPDDLAAAVVGEVVARTGLPAAAEIGRASCRERGEGSAGDEEGEDRREADEGGGGVTAPPGRS